MAEEKQRLSPQEIQERKISLVKERGSRVLLINSPLGATLCTILRQFDLAYANFKGRLDFTDKLCHRIHFRYYTPREIEEYLRAMDDMRSGGKHQTDSSDELSDAGNMAGNRRGDLPQ